MPNFKIFPYLLVLADRKNSTPEETWWILTTQGFLIHASYSIIFINGWKFKVSKILNLKIEVLKLIVCLQNINNFKIKSLVNCLLKTSKRSYCNLTNSAFWGWLSMEGQPQILHSGIILKTFAHALWRMDCEVYDNWPGTKNSWIILKTLTHVLWK